MKSMTSFCFGACAVLLLLAVIVNGDTKSRTILRPGDVVVNKNGLRGFVTHDPQYVGVVWNVQTEDGVFQYWPPEEISHKE